MANVNKHTYRTLSYLSGFYCRPRNSIIITLTAHMCIKIQRLKLLFILYNINLQILRTLVCHDIDASQEVNNKSIVNTSTYTSLYIQPIVEKSTLTANP